MWRLKDQYESRINLQILWIISILSVSSRPHQPVGKYGTAFRVVIIFQRLLCLICMCKTPLPYKVLTRACEPVSSAVPIICQSQYFSSFLAVAFFPGNSRIVPVLLYPQSAICPCQIPPPLPGDCGASDWFVMFIAPA